MVTALSQLDPDGTYTYADYLLWKFEERVELLRGKVRQMAAPSRKHQGISMRMSWPLANALWKSPCHWIVSPIEKMVQVWKLNEEGKYIGLPPVIEDDLLTTALIPGLQIDLKEVFMD